MSLRVSALDYQSAKTCGGFRHPLSACGSTLVHKSQCRSFQVRALRRARNCAGFNLKEPIQPLAPAPWILTGQAVAFLAGPTTLRLLVNYASSPVGPYLEHALSVATWRGPRVVQMSVNSEASKLGGRAIWGYPKSLEQLSWRRDGDRLVFRRESQTFRLRIRGASFPVAAPFWTIQTLNGADVRVPASIKARARLAWHGRQLAIFLEQFEMKFEPPQPI